MAILRITNFGGEIPRVSARALPEGAAQTNSNLLATASEFRPLLADNTVGAAPAGAKTLYRLSRNSAGVLRSADTDGWIAETADKNYVKGQIVDDATERTYVSFNNGTAALRAIDVSGADRLLGVPPPNKPVTALQATTQFTLSQANDWLIGTMTPALLAAIGGATYMGYAGPYDNVGMASAAIYPSYASAAELVYRIDETTAKANGLNDAQLGGKLSGGYLYLTVTAIPQWALLNQTTLQNSLRPLTSPKSGTQLFTDAQLITLSNTINVWYDPEEAGVKTLRTTLGAAVKDFMDGVSFVLTPTTTKPVEPSKPTVPEFSWSGGEGGYSVRNSLWDAYDAAMVTYRAGLASASSSSSANTADKTARIAAMVKAQATAAALTAKIEKIYTDRKAALSDAVTALLNSRGLVQTDTNLNGLVRVDPDRIIDTRFYLATFVTEWGEESAPSVVSDMLEVDQNDKVNVIVQAPPVGINIVKWRLYRSNVGSQQTNFQFVDEMLIGTLSYLDALNGADLGEVLPSLTWLEPPHRTNSSGGLKGVDPYLRDLVGMPNGVMAAHLDNFVAFCEPYLPYAWPVEYQIPIEFPIVGKGVFGQTLFVGTMGNPYLISGSDSASMSAQKLDSDQSCLSRRSIVSMQGGVLYASPDGICYASQGGVEVITNGLFAREDWQALSPASIIAVANEGVYYFCYSGSYGGANGGCLALDMVAKKLTRVDLNATAVFKDIITDSVFCVSSSAIKRAFASGRRTGQWKSGRVVLPKQSGFVWLQVDGAHSAGTPATVIWHRYKENAAGVLIDDPKTYNITNTQPTRVHDGCFIEHEIEVVSVARLTKVGLYGSTQDLKNG